VIDSVFSLTRNVFTAHIITVSVVFFGAESDRSSGSLAHGALRPALGFRRAFRRLALAPRGCI
jgi:hypothetical protein